MMKKLLGLVLALASIGFVGLGSEAQASEKTHATTVLSASAAPSGQRTATAGVSTTGVEYERQLARELFVMAGESIVRRMWSGICLTAGRLTLV